MLNPNDIRLCVRSVALSRICFDDLHYDRKENQAKQAKKEAEAKEKAVRRVYASGLISYLCPCFAHML